MIIDISKDMLHLKKVNQTDIKRVAIRDVMSYVPVNFLETFDVSGDKLTLATQDIIGTYFSELCRVKEIDDTMEDYFETHVSPRILREADYYLSVSGQKQTRYLQGLNNFFTNTCPVIEEFDYYDTNIVQDFRFEKVFDSRLLMQLSKKSYVVLNPETGVLEKLTEGLVDTTLKIMEDTSYNRELYDIAINSALGDIYMVSEESSQMYSLVFGYSELLNTLMSMYLNRELVEYRLAKFVGLECWEELQKLGYSKESIFQKGTKSYTISTQLPNGTFVLTNLLNREDILLLTDIHKLPLKTDILENKLMKLSSKMTSQMKDINWMKQQINRLNVSVADLNLIIYNLTQDMSKEVKVNKQLWESTQDMALRKYEVTPDIEKRMWDMYKKANSNPVLHRLLNK